MPTKTNRQSLDLLVELADYRMVTLSQIAILRFGSKRSARRRTQELLERGLVEVLPIRSGREAGRPEGVYGLSGHGHRVLHDEGLLPKAIFEDLTTGQKLLSQGSHQILLNWVRVHLVHLGRQLSRIAVRFLSCNSPLAWLPQEGRSLLNDEVEMNKGILPERFTPDAAFTLTDRQQGKSVLFLLEVDRGTEPLQGGNSNRSDIENKIRRYQEYFRSKGYKRYQDVFEASLNGFRLLFLTCTDSRLEGLCSLVRGMPPSDFIWLTTEERMHLKGISGAIWFRGGRIEDPTESILGRLVQDLPLPNLDN